MIVLPEEVVSVVRDAPPGTARVMATSLLGGDPDAPILCVVANSPAIVVLMETLLCGVQHAPDAERKEAWKSFARTLAGACSYALTDDEGTPG